MSMIPDLPPASNETRQQGFERILALDHFQGLKAILERLGAAREALCAAMLEANNFEQLLARLGHKLVLTRQIHVQDAFFRMGRESGIKAVLPYHDIRTQSSLPSLVNFDCSLTTTPKAVAFFDELLGEFKHQLSVQL